MREQPPDSPWLFSTASVTDGSRFREQPPRWHASSRALSPRCCCTRLILPCPKAMGRWLLCQEAHRNICCPTEEAALAGTAARRAGACWPHPVGVYKMPSLEGRQEKGKAAKNGKAFLSRVWYESSSGWEGRRSLLCRRGNRAL